jgi:hypothetical protein
MTTESDRLEELAAQIDRRERVARRRALVYTMVPIVVAALLIWFTFLRVRSAGREVARYEKQATDAQQRVTELNEVLKSTEEKLRQSTEFRRHMYQIGWMDDKFLASRYPIQADMLLDIIELSSRVKWKLGGRSPSEGFDSPGFAAYMINKHHLFNVPNSKRYQLKELIPPAAAPQIGDLVFYETGFTMFYFTDRRDRPFCIGMTPAGIAALDLDFGATLLGYGRLNYRRP